MMVMVLASVLTKHAIRVGKFMQWIIHFVGDFHNTNNRNKKTKVRFLIVWYTIGSA